MNFGELLLNPLFFVFDPSKRIFFVYLLSSLVLAFVVLFFKTKDLNKTYKELFNFKTICHASSQADIGLLFINSVIKGLFFFFIVFNSLAMTKWALHFLNNQFPNFEKGRYSYTFIIVSYSVLSFVLLDLARFLQHYCFHKVPFLWRFHKVHHSAFVMTPLTLYRTHPVESLVSAFRRIIVTGGLSAIFIFFTGPVIDAYAILGVNAFDFAFNFFGSNLRHSHVWLSFGALNHVFVSPAQHQIHHSRALKHRDKNLGFAFSLWDKLFGTFYQVHGKEFLIFGVRGESHKGLVNALKAPFS